MCSKLDYNVSEKFNDFDKPVIYIRKFDEYGLKIFDGGTSSIIIAYCPWCGKKLPDSKREKWFDQIESLEIDPWSENIPSKYLTDEWYKT